MRSPRFPVTRGPNLDAVLDCAEFYRLSSAEAKTIVAEVRAVVLTWPERAKQLAISRAETLALSGGRMRRGLDDRKNLSRPERRRLPFRWNRLETFTEKSCAAARTDNAAHNLAVLRYFVLNLIRLAPVKRKGGLKVQCLIAATSDVFRAQLLGLV
jgi:hypothetical protein